MTFRKYLWLAIVGALTIVLLVGTSSAFARGGRGGGGGFRGGGGGSRGGGSFSRPSYSGSGSVRYSSSSRSSSSRSSSSSYSRSSGSSYARPSTPTAVQRPAGGSVARPSTPTARPSTPGAVQRPAGGSSTGSIGARPSTPTYRPGNSGSIINRGTIDTPGGSTIGWVNGPGKGGAVGIKGPDGGTAGVIKGPGGGGAAGIRGPDGGAVGGIRGPGGGSAAGVKGPDGGAAGVIRGPGGGAAAGVVGPGGAAAGAVRGPAGGGAVGVKGPYGGAAGAVWGPRGYGVAGVRGPYGGRYVTTLPNGAFRYPWHGNDYYCFGFAWYSPCWVGDSVYYGWAYPPIGYYYPSLPPEYNTTVINNTNYYESDGVYYQEGEKDGKKGYVVAEAPPGAESTEPPGENPFSILKTMCDYVAGLQTLSLVVNTTTDELGASGEKVQISSRRAINVSRPDKIAVDASGDKGERRVVYDGKKISMLDRTQNAYSVIQAPSTIDATLDMLVSQYGIALPLGDLLYKNLYERLEAQTSAGQYLGLHEVNGLKCHHLAFLTQTVSWEIWVETGDKPVPRKIAIDYGQDAARSRYSADVFAWTGSPTFAPATFDFKMPSIAKRVEIPKVSNTALSPVTTRKAE